MNVQWLTPDCTADLVYPEVQTRLKPQEKEEEPEGQQCIG